MSRFLIAISAFLIGFFITAEAVHTEAVKVTWYTPNPASGQVAVATQIAESVASAQIAISSLSGNREMLVNVSPTEPTATVNVSGLADGIHIVSLYINGQLVDSCRLIKE